MHLHLIPSIWIGKVKDNDIVSSRFVESRQTVNLYLFVPHRSKQVKHSCADSGFENQYLIASYQTRRHRITWYFERGGKEDLQTYIYNKQYPQPVQPIDDVTN
jgi:hypothetical protein